MTPEDLTRVQAMLPSVAARADELSLVFYARLFALDPSLRSLFPGDLAAQRAKFVATLRAIIEALTPRDAFVPPVAELGADHIRYETKVKHYTVVGDALLWALRTTLPESWTPAVGEAWALAYDLVAETMLGGAADTPFQGTES